MKRIILVSILNVFFFSGVLAQTPQSRSERRAERQENRIQEVQTMLENKSFVFSPTHAMPLGGGSIHLSHTFEAEIRGDSIFSYLPFFGVAYRAEYGGRDIPFSFSLPLEKYNMTKDDKGYQINLEVKNKMDYISYMFHISELGYATLSITSTNRQAISFYGRVEKPESSEK